MKNYFYLTALCCLLYSCGEKTDAAIQRPEGIWYGENDAFIYSSVLHKDSVESPTGFYSAMKEFEILNPGLEIVGSSFFPRINNANGGVHLITKSRELEPTDESIFLIDKTNSLVMELKSIKAVPKPKTGRGTYYDFNEVFFRYKLEHGEYVLDIIQIPTTDESVEKQNDVKDETNKNSIDPRILGPQKKSGATASLTPKQHVFHRDTIDGFVTESYIGEDGFIHWNDYSLPGYNEELK